MDDNTLAPFEWPDHEAPSCCTAEQAWAWTNAIAEMAVDGDDDARRALPEAVDHYLAAIGEIVQ